MATINLFGASGHAKVVMDIIKAQGDGVGCLYDDNPKCDYIHEITVYKASETTVNGPMIISIGSCKIRKLIAERYTVEYVTAIHPKAVISDSAKIGNGSVVMPGAIINADVSVGRHCIINTKASVDHESIIGDYVHIAPGATLSGNVEVGECSWIGVGACVKQGIKIGKNCMIGAGSVVVKDIPDGTTAYGNPAIIKTNNYNMQYNSKLGGVNQTFPLLGCMKLRVMQPNILITSAGKRVELLLEFRRELKAAFPEAKILTVDLNPSMSPACHLSDEAFTVPRVTAPEYINRLLEICRQNNVRLIVPTIDTELLILANSRQQFSDKGIEVMVSDSEFIVTCRDKRKTMALFDYLGIRNPAPRDKYNPVFPMFAKPYDGSLSTNIHILKSTDDLTAEILSDPKLMFMEYIEKAQYKEYTVDMYYDREGFVKSIVPRERIEIRSGEVNKGAARKNYLVSYLKERMNHMPRVRGCICIQLFYRESDNDVVGIEINPRYGGGYPLSYYAGANFPAMMIEEYIKGGELEYSDSWRDNTLMLRFDSQVIVNE